MLASFLLCCCWGLFSVPACQCSCSRRDGSRISAVNAVQVTFQLQFFVCCCFAAACLVRWGCPVSPPAVGTSHRVLCTSSPRFLSNGGVSPCPLPLLGPLTDLRPPVLFTGPVDLHSVLWIPSLFLVFASSGVSPCPLPLSGPLTDFCLRRSPSAVGFPRVPFSCRDLSPSLL